MQLRINYNNILFRREVKQIIHITVSYQFTWNYPSWGLAVPGDSH